MTISKEPWNQSWDSTDGTNPNPTIQGYTKTQWMSMNDCHYDSSTEGKMANMKGVLYKLTICCSLKYLMKGCILARHLSMQDPRTNSRWPTIEYNLAEAPL